MQNKKLKFSTLFTLFLILILTACGGNGNGYEEQNLSSYDPLDGITGYIHRVTYGDNVAYIFGSMHVSRDDWFPLAPVVEDAMRRADVFAFEIYLDDMLSDMMAAMFDGTLLIEDNQTLTQILPDGVAARLIDEILPTYEGMSYELLGQFNPVGFAMTLMQGPQLQALEEQGLDATNTGVDGYISDFARENEKPIIGLEPNRQQLLIAFAPDASVLEMAGFDYYTIEEIGISAIENLMTFDQVLEHSLRYDLGYYYSTNNFERVNALLQPRYYDLNTPFGRYMLEVLMNFRTTYYGNRVAQLLRETEESTTFFVTVGLAHVMRTGEHFSDNLILHLTGEGFDVEPLFE